MLPTSTTATVDHYEPFLELLNASQSSWINISTTMNHVSPLHNRNKGLINQLVNNHCPPL